MDEKGDRLRFGEFTLCLDRHALFFNEERVHITEKPLETLTYLAKNQGRVVEKNELLDAVWKGTFVTEDTLVHAVREVRRVLGDDKDAPTFIQTVPRQGYRFVADVFDDGSRDEDQQEKTRAAPGANSPFRSVVPTRRWIAGVAITVAGLVGTFILGILIYSYSEPRYTRLKPETQTQMTSGEFSAGKPALSPDGNLMLCVWSSPETRGYGDIFVVSKDGRSTRVTTRMNPSGDIPVFTADSNNIVFSRYRNGNAGNRLPDLNIVPTSGHVESRIYIPEAAGAGFSPNGRHVAYTKFETTRNALWISETADLDNHTEIATNGFTPRFSPDGKWLAYTTSDPEGGLGDLWIVDAVTLSKHRNLTNEKQQLYGLTWTPDNREIIFSSKRSGIHMLWQVSADGGELRPLMPTYGGYASAPSISADGSTLVFQYGRIAKNIRLATVGKTESENLTTDELHSWVKFSRSGSRLASVVQRHDFGKDIAVFDLSNSVEGAKNTRFSVPDLNPEYLSWIDDEHLAYLTEDPDHKTRKVVVLNTANGMFTPLTSFDGSAAWLAVHPVGKRVAVVIDSANKSQRIVVRDLERQSDGVIADGGQYAGLRWSPDGSKLLWSGPIRAAGTSSSGVWSWSNEEFVKLVNNGYGPIIDGETLYFSRFDEMIGLWAKTQNYRPILSWADNVTSFDVSNGRVAYIEASETVKAQVYSVELER